mmetsp:Transcript_3283/g.7670  ORF Transcript_3283/g.7670 Transcript_3283/m.7670 type:complete len:220 (-) Transcript_3283:1028-1687(-)
MNNIVDAGNGSGEFFAENVLQPLGAETSGSQFLDLDGTFPNHSPNLEDADTMASAVAATFAVKADLGASSSTRLVFDGQIVPLVAHSNTEPGVLCKGVDFRFGTFISAKQRCNNRFHLGEVGAWSKGVSISGNKNINGWRGLNKGPCAAGRGLQRRYYRHVGQPHQAHYATGRHCAARAPGHQRGNGLGHLGWPRRVQRGQGWEAREKCETKTTMSVVK